MLLAAHFNVMRLMLALSDLLVSCLRVSTIYLFFFLSLWLHLLDVI